MKHYSNGVEQTEENKSIGKEYAKRKLKELNCHEWATHRFYHKGMKTVETFEAIGYEFFILEQECMNFDLVNNKMSDSFIRRTLCFRPIK
jgi:hypothetical protein